MQWNFEKKEGEKGVTGRFIIRGEVGVTEASSLKEALQEGLDACDHLVLDCDGLEGLDVAVLQIFCALNCYAVMKNKGITAEIPAGGELEKALRESGFKRHEVCPLTPSGEPCMWVSVASN